MSRKLTSFIVGVVGLFALAVGTMQGCGGGSGSSFVSVCNQACEKANSCYPDPAGLTACKNACSQLHCSNEAAITAKTQECLKISDCTAAGVCAQDIPDCQTTGTGGTN